MSNIVPLDPVMLRAAADISAGPEGGTSRVGGGAAGGKDFGAVLENLVRETDELQKTSDTALRTFGAGQTDDLHTVMMAMAKADLSFKLMLEVRNKLLDAYQEVMRLQV